MTRVTVRNAHTTDIESILDLFLTQIPFLQEHVDRARKDVVYRIEDERSRTVIALIEDRLVGVARGHAQDNIYIMNSMCIIPDASLAQRTRILAAMLPFFLKSCIEHAKKLGVTRAFYGTDVGSIARLVPLLCSRRGLAIEPGEWSGEDGFWITYKSS